MTLAFDVVLPNLPGALLIFTLRCLGIFAGSYVGGVVVGAPAEHTSRYWMTFIVQAGVTLGLAQRTSSLFADSFGPSLALVITAEVVLNQLVGPLLFKAALISVGEARPKYSPSNEPGKMGLSPPTRPLPRSGVVIARSSDPEAEAVCTRLIRRGWAIARCDLQTPLSALPSAPVPCTLGSAAQPPAEMSARRAGRLSSLLGSISKSHPNLAAYLIHLRALVASSAADGNHARGATLDDHVDMHVDHRWEALPTPADAVADAEVETVLKLLWALASLDSPEAIVLMLPTDEETTRVVRLLTRACAPLLLHLHPRQTATPQLLARVRDVSCEATLHAQGPENADGRENAEGVAERGCAGDNGGVFKLVTIVDDAAVPNLLADMLHPEAHWSHSVDNTMP